MYVVLVPFSASVLSQPAHAQAYKPLECTNTGQVVDGTSLYAADQGAASEATCELKGVDNMFSAVLCNFLLVLNDVLGKLYCSMQVLLKDVLSVLLTLYLATFGVQLMLGTAQVNTRDIIVRLTKIAAVWIIATQASWGIGKIFMFVIGFMTVGSGWVLGALENHSPLEVGKCVQNATEEGVMPFFIFLDCMVSNTFSGALAAASVKVVGLFIVLAAVYPPLFGLAMWWGIKTFLTMAKAVVSFVLALASIGFLVAMSPIFLAMMLFQFTNSLFENWMRFMIAYAVQVILVFAIIVMWLLVFFKFLTFFTNLADIVFPNAPMLERSSDVTPVDTWSICPPIFESDPNTGAPLAFCKDSDFNPYEDLNPDDWQNDAKKLRLPSDMVTDGDFLYYIFYHLVSLMTITYAFSALLDEAHKIAQRIAGATAMPAPLAGGFGQNVGGAISKGLGGGVTDSLQKAFGGGTSGVKPGDAGRATAPPPGVRGGPKP